MRIGVGVVAGENQVTFVLSDGAVHLLDEDTDELVDGDDVAKFRASLRQLGVPFHVEASELPRDPAWNAEKHPVISVSREEIAGLMRRARSFIGF